MLRYAIRRSLFRPLVFRCSSSRVVQPPRSRSKVNRVLAASGVSLMAYILFSGNTLGVHAEAVDESTTDSASQTPLNDLIRQYAVYTMCSSPTLVDWAPAILETLTSIPIVKQITEAFVSKTFFLQFVGGSTTDDCVPLLKALRQRNIGVLFAYSVEVDEEEASGHGDNNKPKEALHKRIVKEMVHSIDVAGGFEDDYVGEAAIPNHRRTWVAIKLTALVPDHVSLINFSKDLVKSAHSNPHSPTIAFPGCPSVGDIRALELSSPAPGSYMSSTDLADIVDLYQDLKVICSHAHKRGVRIIIDAEYSWYQPAVDVLALELMREYNRLPASEEKAALSVTPLIYTTFQCYLRRTPAFLAQSIKDAQAGNFALGVKLVRGAYHEQENEAHSDLMDSRSSSSISPDTLPPVWSSKADTDNNYNACARILLNMIAQDVSGSRSSSGARAPAIGVLFGSHNWDSIRDILKQLELLGLAKPVGAYPASVQPDGRALPEESVLELSTEVAERLTFGQLYGMSNTLTNYMVARTRSSTPVVLKYIPYGSLSEVMPYLARRAIENKAVLGNGQAAMERKQAWMEIRKKLGFGA